MSRAGVISQGGRLTARLEGGVPGWLVTAVVFSTAMLISLAILLHFHDRFWWGPDEGAYAHVAERILQGEVLNGTVQDIHMGYVNFTNALALYVFGLDLVSLRYPLVVMTLIQCGLAFWWLSGRGHLVAFTAALVMSSLTLVQFLNPTAHWYALFLCMLTIALLSTEQRTRERTLELLGFLVVTLFLFRQLSGIFVAMGVLTFLLLQDQRTEHRHRALLARVLTLLMLGGLLFYLTKKTDLTAALLFGSGPVLLLVYVGTITRMEDRRLAGSLLRMGLGGLIASFPLIAYHWMHGSLTSWWADTVLSALRLTEMPFVDKPNYLGFGFMGLARALDGESFGTVVNGLFWMVLPLLPSMLALSMLAMLRQGCSVGRAALPVIAAFFALVSVHYQIPIYLFYTTALTATALLFLTAQDGRFSRLATVCFCVTLSLIGLVYQAGQPLSRDWIGTLEGHTDTPMAPSGLPHASLVLTEEDGALYRHLVEIIATRSSAGDYILTLPSNPELYFIAERRNPLRFFNAAHGMHDEGDLRNVEEILATHPPRLVFYLPEDKYNTPLVRQLMAGLKERYDLIEEREGFEVYLSRED